MLRSILVRSKCSGCSSESIAKITRSRYLGNKVRRATLILIASSVDTSFTMARGTPFYLTDSFIHNINKRPNLLKRELGRIFGDDPEGKTVPYEIIRYTLGVVAVGALILPLAVAPGAARGVYWFMDAIKKSTDPYARRIAKYKYLKRVMRRLHDQGFIKTAKRRQKEIAVLTDKGMAKLMSYAVDDLTIPKPVRWDRVWRVLAFDIPEKRKFARDALRAKLRDLGLLQFQKSVFVYPHPCRDEIEFVTEIFDIWDCTTFFETFSLGRQEPEARRHFDLL